MALVPLNLMMLLLHLPRKGSGLHKTKTILQEHLSLQPLWNFKTSFVYRDEALNHGEYAICQRKHISLADMEAG